MLLEHAAAATARALTVRARNLKPGFFKNEVLGSADPLYGLLFQGLWLMADCEGRLEDRPLRICALVFPYRRNVTEKRCDAMLSWLAEAGFIIRYTGDDGKPYIQVVAFSDHQRPHPNEQASKIPALKPNGDAPRTVPERTKVESEGAPRSSPNRASSLNPSSLNPHSLNPSSSRPHSPAPPEEGRRQTSNGPQRLTADAALKPLHPRSVKSKNGAASKTAEELRSDARKLAESGQQVGEIVRVLSQYHVTADQVQEWIA